MSAEFMGLNLIIGIIRNLKQGERPKVCMSSYIQIMISTSMVGVF